MTGDADMSIVMVDINIDIDKVLSDPKAASAMSPENTGTYPMRPIDPIALNTTMHNVGTMMNSIENGSMVEPEFMNALSP